MAVDVDPAARLVCPLNYSGYTQEKREAFLLLFPVDCFTKFQFCLGFDVANRILFILVLFILGLPVLMLTSELL